jgi:hypothetical protein
MQGRNVSKYRAAVNYKFPIFFNGLGYISRFAWSSSLGYHARPFEISGPLAYVAISPK